MKLSIMILELMNFGVAPLTGAWIETQIHWPLGEKIAVAPLTGAWIETR